MKLHTENFISTKFDNDMSIFYVENDMKNSFYLESNRMHTFVH